MAEPDDPREWLAPPLSVEETEALCNRVPRARAMYEREVDEDGRAYLRHLFAHFIEMGRREERAKYLERLDRLERRVGALLASDEEPG
jgi:hypothetical protein